MSTSSQSTPKIDWLPLLISIGINLAIGITAAYFTKPEIDVWYRGLNKPGFTPPDWLFAPVWTALYIMIGVSAYLFWQKRDESVNYYKARSMYVMQLIFNFFWSYVFFKMHNPLGGAVIIVVLIMLISSCIFYFSKFDKLAPKLLIPYLVWVCYAAALNIGILLLN